MMMENSIQLMSANLAGFGAKFVFWWENALLTLCSPDVLYVDNLAVFPAKFRAGRL
jgi:hypothetical protein